MRSDCAPVDVSLALQKLSRVIGFFSDQSRWYQGGWSKQSQHCALNYILTLRGDALELLEHPILRTAEVVTGRRFKDIPDFNDSVSYTTFMEVLWATRKYFVEVRNARRRTAPVHQRELELPLAA